MCIIIYVHAQPQCWLVLFVYSVASLLLLLLLSIIDNKIIASYLYLQYCIVAQHKRLPPWSSVRTLDTQLFQVPPLSLCRR